MLWPSSSSGPGQAARTASIASARSRSAASSSGTAAAGPAGLTVAAQVVAGDLPAEGVQARRERRMAADVLAQAVHDEHAAARRAGERPGLALQHHAIGCAKGKRGCHPRYGTANDRSP